MKKFKVIFIVNLFIFIFVSGTFVQPAQDSSSGPFAYVTNADSDTVSVIDTVNNAVVATVPVGEVPIGVAIMPLTP